MATSVVESAPTALNAELKSNTQENVEQEKDADKEASKTKIFDNKNFVEAPLPKTNPWKKPAPVKVPVSHAATPAPNVSKPPEPKPAVIGKKNTSLFLEIHIKSKFMYI